MTVRKYRAIGDMEDTFWIPPGTERHRRAIQFVLESVSLLVGRRKPPPGVFKFRSVEEARRQREGWERQESP